MGNESATGQNAGGAGCLGCLGVFGIIAVVAVVGTIITGVMNPKDACDEAREARVLSRTLDDPDDRYIASMQYAVKAQECASIGGTVD